MEKEALECCRMKNGANRMREEKEKKRKEKKRKIMGCDF